ncbi:alpha-amylase family glycosyl hydrolase [Mesobacterium sp. TK19101]|uniref:Alpha-amylase family glycosyl hydrolase n=1 Tax=Mesobacterium hydrothermale TaxID=3111907 RepID=A0ABU6HI73_9RHOB|nr:alpha-amylase family glycosyl hydrolase [Mesobacterium sp. TK19101]MEC3861143.1 alpha-amylase family glycosyl hydrolase [Mesobacterium sp. TK19101]
MNAETKTQGAQAVDKDWWRGAVVYQIYPRSYQDSNGDGVGDLLGIAARMPHIASLGVDAIWISPFFTSPMKDFGYDVSDYCDVDPMFGSLADFDVLVQTAHQLGIKVLIDLVLSHTSDQHPWFIESRSDRDNPKADWYVWSDPKDDGTPPNNWLSIFGGSAWQWDARRCQYYLHNFLTSQPDLNFWNLDVQDALLDVVRFWLDRGVDGFRLDTINFYFADKELRDNPALPADQRNSAIAPAVNPYNHQLHTHSKNQPENLEFLRRFRKVLDSYPAATSVGEVGDAQRGLEIMGEYTSGGDKVHMCYAFEFLSGSQLTAQMVADVMTKVDEVAGEGWACWAFSNHDVVRHVTRWNLTPAAARLFTTMIMCLKGSVCIYQGEELGLPEADVAFEDLQDPYGIEFWPEFKGRDGCRTPMVWEPSNQNGGFTTGQPWLPVSHDHLNRSVASQEHDPGALLHHYRRAIAFRHAHPALIRGDHDGVTATGTVVHFTRILGDAQIFCAFNLSAEPAVLDMPAGDWAQIGLELGSTAVQADGKLHLGPWQPCLALKMNA